MSGSRDFDETVFDGPVGRCVVLFHDPFIEVRAVKEHDRVGRRVGGRFSGCDHLRTGTGVIVDAPLSAWEKGGVRVAGGLLFGCRFCLFLGKSRAEGETE